VALNVATLQATITADTGPLEAGLNKSSGLLEGFGGRLGGLGIAAAGAGAALAAGFGVGVKAAGDLEQSVANISTIAPQIDTSQVFNALNEMQTRVPQTAAQLGDSLYNIFSSVSDITAEAALNLTETFAKGATGAQTSAETFGTAVIGVMNAYGLSVSDAAHISDVFFNTVNKGVVTGGELAQNLGLVTQSAKLAGVNIDELGGFIAGVTKEGGSAAQNINNLSNLFLKLNTNDSAKGFRALGISVTDATGHLRPAIDVLQDLKTKTDAMTDAGKQAALQKIFPDLQARAGAAVILNELDFVKGAIQDNIEQSGSAASAFEKMNATFNSQTKILQQTLMSVLTTLGATVLPAITPLITAFSQALPGALRTAQASFAALGAAIAVPVQVLKDSFGTVMQVFAGDWSPDPSKVHPFTEAVGEFAVVMRDQVIPAVQLTAQWLGSSLPPAVASAQAAFASISGTVGPIFADIKATVNDIASVLRDQLPPAAQDAASQINVLSVAFGLLAGAVRQILGPIALGAQMWRSYADTAAAVSAANRQIAISLGTTLQQAAAVAVASINRISEAFNAGGAAGGLTALSNELSAGLSALATVVGPALAPVGEAIGAFFSEVGTGAHELVQDVGDAFSGLGSLVQGEIDAAGADIIGAWESAVDAPTRQLLADLVAAVGDLFGAMADLTAAKMAQLAAAVDAGWAAVTASTGAALAALGAAVDAGWAAITAAVSAAMAAILAAVTPGWASVQSTTEASNAAIQAAVDAAWNALNGIISAAMASVSGTVTAAWNGIVSNVEGILSGLAGSASSFGSGMVEAFASGIRSRLQSVLNSVREMVQQIRDLMPGSDAKRGPLSDLTASGKALPETLAKGVSSGASSFEGAVTSALWHPALVPSMPSPLLSAPAMAVGSSPAGQPSGTTIVIQGPIYGFDDFQAKVEQAYSQITVKQGRERSRNLR
jgi:TP901 family phage tail tape measure protein